MNYKVDLANQPENMLLIGAQPVEIGLRAQLSGVIFTTRSQAQDVF